MVSGYDKPPPDPRYEPEFGHGVRFIIIAVVAVLALGSIGWLFV